MFAVGHFESCRTAIAATEDALALEPAAVELIDRTILALSRSKLEYRPLADTLEGDPGALLFVSLRGRHATRYARSSTPRAGTRYHTHRAPRRAAEQAALTKVRKAGLGLLMAASEGARRPARVRRGHRGRARAARRLRRALPARSSTRHGLDGRLLRPLLGRLPAHPPVRRPHASPADRDAARGRDEIVDARRRVRRRELLRARRRPRAQPRSTGASSATSCTARCGA